MAESMDYINTIFQGDTIDQMRKLPEKCVNTCVTSPPYYGLRDYGVDGQIGLEETPNQYIQRLVDVFREVRRVLRDDGTLWVNIGDSYTGGGAGRNDGDHRADGRPGGMSYKAEGVTHNRGLCGLKPKDLIGIPWMLAFALRADGWYLRQDIIWHKPNPMPESVTDRCTKSHEYIFMLSKSSKYYYDNEAIKELCVNSDPASPRGSKGTKMPDAGRRGEQDELGKQTYTGFNERYFSKPPLQKRNKRDIWTVATKPYKGAHFATYPLDLIKPCILAGAPKDGVVLDPFMGSGTTAVCALQNRRQYIGTELNPKYIELAKKRITLEGVYQETTDDALTRET